MYRIDNGLALYAGETWHTNPFVAFEQDHLGFGNTFYTRRPEPVSRSIEPGSDHQEWAAIPHNHAHAIQTRRRAARWRVCHSRRYGGVAQHLRRCRQGMPRKREGASAQRDVTARLVHGGTPTT